MTLAADRIDSPSRQPAAVRSGPGRLSIEFVRDDSGRTYVGHQYASYPFHVCRPLYLDKHCPALATLYAQSCSGGLYADDEHRLELIAREASEAHFTTQASTIVHSMEHGRAVIDMRIIAERGAYLEYLPDPQILFPRASVISAIRISMADDATVLVSDSWLTHDHRQDGGLPSLYQSEIAVENSLGRKLAIDRLRLDSRAFASARPGVLGNFHAHGTLLVATQSLLAADLCGWGQRQSWDYGEAAIGVSTLPNGAGMVFRIMARDAVLLKRAMHTCWHDVRLALKSHAPTPRRK